MKFRLLRAAVLVLALMLALATLPACANTGKTLLTLETDGKAYTYSVNLYELYLSAVKGDLVKGNSTINGANAATDKYWNTMDTIDGKLQTLNDYYLTASLKQCKDVLIALYLFDSYGLSLSASEKDNVEAYLDELIKTDGKGSKTNLNAVLADYGVNYDIMREHYTNMAKIKVLREHIYSTLGDNIKEEYLEENYVHFQQIYLAKFNYVYKTDKNGDAIYYNPSTGAVCYKETKYVKYENGDAVFYTDDTYTHVSYDKENGKPANETDGEGGYKTTPKTEQELTDLASRATLLLHQVKLMSDEEFETAVVEESDDATAAATYTDGYYLNKNNLYGDSDETLEFLDTVITELEKIEDGEIILLETDTGYHIVKKYAPSKKAYEMEENNVWFTNFSQEMTNLVFAEQAKSYYDKITVDEAVLSAAKNMKQVAVNYFYYAYQ